MNEIINWSKLQLIQESHNRKSIEKPSATIYKIVACLTGSCGSRGNGKTNAFSTIEIMEDSPVDVDVKHWFSMQNIGVEDPNTSSQLTSEEQLAESLLEKCTYYDAIKRYEHTKLLWIDLLTFMKTKTKLQQQHPELSKIFKTKK